MKKFMFNREEKCGFKEEKCFGGIDAVTGKKNVHGCREEKYVGRGENSVTGEEI